jgi:hypothetical protein
MNHTYSVFRILFSVSLCLFIAFSSCKNKSDSEIKTTNAVSADTNSNYASLSDSALSGILDKSISEFSGRQGALNNWIMYNEDNKMNAEKVLTNRILYFHCSGNR